jgi:hypothetical protein
VSFEEERVENMYYDDEFVRILKLLPWMGDYHSHDLPNIV